MNSYLKLFIWSVLTYIGALAGIIVNDKLVSLDQITLLQIAAALLPVIPQVIGSRQLLLDEPPGKKRGGYA